MDWLIRQVFRRIVTRGDLTIVAPSGARLRFGDGSGDPVVVRLTDRRAVLALVADPDMRLGELYMDGRFVVETGTMLDFLVLCLREAQGASHSAVARVLDRARELLWRWRLPNGARRSRRNVAHHYDLDGRLYDLFLDADRQYSCAYFADPTASLEEAQRDKKRHIIRKLRLRPGDSVLDIGCGWGGLAHAVAEAGAGAVVGVTLSEEQLAYARARPVKGAVAPRFDLIDYRSVTGRFDRIVSVGMFEHIGRAALETFFRTAHRLMANDGVMLLHTIGCAAGTGFTTPWVDKYIFPGGYIPALSEITLAIERAELMVADVEVLHTHYAWTLAEWRRRFLARRAEAVALYDERFCRMWEYYLSAAEAAFLCENLVIFQVQIVKRPQTAPTRRDYLYPAAPSAAVVPEPKP